MVNCFQNRSLGLKSNSTESNLVELNQNGLNLFNLVKTSQFRSSGSKWSILVKTGQIGKKKVEMVQYNGQLFRTWNEIVVWSKIYHSSQIWSNQVKVN